MPPYIAIKAGLATGNYPKFYVELEIVSFLYNPRLPSSEENPWNHNISLEKPVA
jgi:hypothetical protein